MRQLNRPALDISALRAALRAPWHRLDVVDETGSTNSDLLARAASGEDVSGTVLLSEQQTAGRGRYGRQWSAPARSQISMSVGIDMSMVSSDRWGWLPLLTGVAVVNAVSRAGIRVGLKWPNDVMVGPTTGKLAGILAEVASSRQVVVVGIGLNVTMRPDEAPDPRATSLAMLGVTDTDRTALASSLLDEFGATILRWQVAHGNDDALAESYRSASHTIGSTVRAILPGDRQIVGIATDIDEIGRLLIRDGKGTTTPVAAADIVHLRS